VTKMTVDHYTSPFINLQVPSMQDHFLFCLVALFLMIIYDVWQLSKDWQRVDWKLVNRRWWW